MKPFFTILLLYPWLALLGWSQITPLPPPSQPFSQLQQYLGLTDSQVNTILLNNNDYNNFMFDQERLIQNAQIEIAAQTAKDQLDALTVGTLYVGIENACRDLRDRAAATQTQNISILTDAQKAKLNMLNEALKLAPIISEAQSRNLLGTPTSSPFGFSNFIIGGFTGLTGFPFGVSGCGMNGAIGVNIYTPQLSSPTQSGLAGLSTTPPAANRTVNHWFDRTDFVRIPGTENGLDQVRKPILEPR
jgi:hypothetical protein